MQEPDTIDFTKLLGFETVAEDLSREVDFQNATIGAKIGAKVGRKMGAELEGLEG